MKIDARAYTEKGKPPVTVEIPITGEDDAVRESEAQPAPVVEAVKEQDSELKNKPTSENTLSMRITELETQLAEKEKTLQDARNDVLRTLAELDTFRRRKNLEGLEIRKYGAEGLLKALLPALLDLDRLVQHSESVTDTGKLVEAIAMLQGKVEKALETAGALKIAPRPSDAFDPNLHEAIGQLPSNEFLPNHVAILVEPGWLLHERLLHAAKVLVAAPETTMESEA
ncbi:MAG: nucleotide exchange factor GrpE [bacterium]|nr:nucleotide exchange factor GrpE [bacterium]